MSNKIETNLPTLPWKIVKIHMYKQSGYKDGTKH